MALYRFPGGALLLAALFAAFPHCAAAEDKPVVDAPKHPGHIVLKGFDASRARLGNTVVRDMGAGYLQYRYDSGQLAIIGEQERKQHRPGGPYLINPGPFSHVDVYKDYFSEPDSQSHADHDALRVEIDPAIDVKNVPTGTPIGFVGDWVLVKGNATWLDGRYRALEVIDPSLQTALRNSIALNPIGPELKEEFGDLYQRFAPGRQRSILEGATVLFDETAYYVEPSKGDEGRLFVVDHIFPHRISWDDFSNHGVPASDEAQFRAAAKERGIDCAALRLCDDNARGPTTSVRSVRWRDVGGRLYCDEDTTTPEPHFAPCVEAYGPIRKDYATRPAGSLISPPWQGGLLVIKGNVLGL